MAPRASDRFEAAAQNKRWTGDALHGPAVTGRKTFLFAFIDDHSRALVGYRWAPARTPSGPRPSGNDDPACLTALVVHSAAHDDTMLVLEQDDTLVVSDRKLLYRATREAGCPDLRYEHRRAAVEHLLALPDAIAWCWAKGGDWRRRIQPDITHIRKV